MAKEQQDWTAQVGRVVGLWLSRGLVKTEKAHGEIVRVTPKMFVVRIEGEDREVKFVRTRAWASSDGMRYEWGAGSKRNPSRVYKNPLPED